ncbi:MAG TPA: hypothetical protein VG015_03640 [Candidatus Dormibacteraeota bacterium]|jgi:hypothetical protein|nr:hypothetical protein [Candidatus Dormibacteraeota bacterium]
MNPRVAGLLTDPGFAAALEVAIGVVAEPPTLQSSPPFTGSERQALERGGADPDADDSEAPWQQAIAEYGLLLTNALTVAQATEVLGVREARVKQRLAERTLFGIKVHGAWRLPRFQFQPGGAEVPGLGEVLRRLPARVHPVELQSWLTSPDPDLEIAGLVVSPLDWLRAGHDPEPLVAEAAEFDLIA